MNMKIIALIILKILWALLELGLIVYGIFTRDTYFLCLGIVMELISQGGKKC